MTMPRLVSTIKNRRAFARRALPALALAALALVICAGASAAPGDLDPTFGSGGTVTTDVGADGGYDWAYTVAVQPDGKIVAAGQSQNSFAVARYNADGTLDTTFGTGGIVTPAVGQDGWVDSIVVQADGKILVGGAAYRSSGYDFALVRLNADGSVDDTFGTNGAVVTDLAGGFAEIWGIALQSDGKIVAAGMSNGGTLDDFALARYNADGTLDSTFGSGGTTLTDFAASWDTARAVALQPDGRIVVAGYSDVDGSEDFSAARYLTDGSLDPTFGTGGKVTTPFGESGGAYALAIQPDGKIVLGGTAWSSGSGSDFALARYGADGTLDAGFGSGGRAITDFGGGSDAAWEVLVQPNGKLVAAGYGDSTNGMAVATYNSDGTLDPAFGNGGTAVADFGGWAYGYGAALQADGRIVVAGQASGSGGSDFAVARFLGDTQGESVATGRAAYCSVAGNYNPFTGAATVPNTFLDLEHDQVLTDPAYAGASVAIFVEGEGLMCGPPPAGYHRDGFAGPDQDMAHGGTYPLYVL